MIGGTTFKGVVSAHVFQLLAALMLLGKKYVFRSQAEAQSSRRRIEDM